MDEPFAALDARTRIEMREEPAAIRRRVRRTDAVARDDAEDAAKDAA